MASLNKVALIGRLGQEPELKYIDGSADPLCQVSLATSEKFKDRQGQLQERTEWHNLVFWGKTAEVLCQYAKKGQMIYVEGALRTESWKKDGETRYSTKIRVSNLQLLQGANAPQAASSAPQQQSNGFAPDGDNDNDLPF